TVVFPAGGQRGTTVELTASGDNVTQAATRLWFSHSEISAEKTGENKFRVRIGPDVPAGLYDVRAAGPRGVTGARTFAVSDFLEVRGGGPNNTPAEGTHPGPLPAPLSCTLNPHPTLIP